MKTETIYEHAKRIDELFNHQKEIARSEGKAFEEYTPRDLVLTAVALVDLMDEWDYHSGTPESRRQKRLLGNFIKKWWPTLT